MIDFLVRNPIRIAIADFLGIVIIENQYMFISFWSIVHLITAGIIMYLLIKYKIGKVGGKFILLYIILALYEILEYVLYTKWLMLLFIPESLIDVISDLIIGMIGGLISYIIFKKKK